MLNADEYRDTYLALHACIQARVPVILWGPPGQGKTSVITSLAKADGRRLEVILASIREPQDFAGLPSIHNGRTTMIAPDWAQDLAEDGNGILFMDEVNTAPPAVQAALLRVSLDKVVGDCHLGENTSVVAAANPPEIAADGWDLAPPLANRFCHLDWNLPADVVRSGLSGQWPQYEVATVTSESFEIALDQERALFSGFITTRPDLVTVLPASTTEAGRAFPTPRSWETALRLMAVVTAAQLSQDVRRVLIRGMVGIGAAIEYLTYRDAVDLPNPEEVLLNASTFELPMRPDQVYAIGISVIHAASRDISDNRVQSLNTVLNLITTTYPDFGGTLIRQYVDTNKSRLSTSQKMLVTSGVVGEMYAKLAGITQTDKPRLDRNPSAKKLA
jgi:MoxR-like ATPase